MKYKFDLAKDRKNIAKHGMSLSEAEGFDWNGVMVSEDRSEAYGEQRFKALGFVGLRICLMIFTMRSDDTIRVISLRKATKAEEKEWERG